MTRNGWIAVMIVATAALLWLVTSMNVREDRQRAPDAQLDAHMEPLDVADELAQELEPQPTQAAPPEAPDPLAAPEAPGAPEAPAPAEAKTAVEDVADLPPPEKTGPVDELKQAFAREPRASSARVLEKEIEAAFKDDNVPPELLKGVLCRTTVCRVEVEWTPARAVGFMAAFTRLLIAAPDSPEPPKLFDSNLAISPEGDPAPNGARSVDVYVARLPQPEPHNE